LISSGRRQPSSKVLNSLAISWQYMADTTSACPQEKILPCIERCKRHFGQGIAGIVHRCIVSGT
jgi:hypothetical protein